MNNLICPFCLQDISNGNHTWNCEMNPVNINNSEFQSEKRKQVNKMFINSLNKNNLLEKLKNEKTNSLQSVDL